MLHGYAQVRRWGHGKRSFVVEKGDSTNEEQKQDETCERVRKRQNGEGNNMKERGK